MRRAGRSLLTHEQSREVTAGEVGLHQGIDLVAVEAAVGKHGEGEQAGGGGAAVGFVVAHDAVSLFVSGLLQGSGRPGGETSVPLQTGAD